MEATAKGKYLRIAPRKMRIVIDTIRQKPANQALAQLGFMQKRAARMAREVLKTAITNAKALKMNVDQLVVAKVFADGGPVFKRFQARAMGRANRILKRTTHLTVVLRESEKVLKPPAAQGATGAKEKKVLPKLKKSASAGKKAKEQKAAVAS